MPANSSSNAPVGIVVVGAGEMGAFHADTVAQLKEANLIAVVDPAQKRAKAVARRLGCKAMAEIGAALDLTGVEAVIIVTPEWVRRQPVASALKRRLPIFLEKPLAISVAEGERLARHVRAARVPFQIGYQRRFDPAIAAIKAQLERWGPPEILRSLTRDPLPPTLEAGLRCGGIVFGTLIHDIDCAQHLAGPIRSVFARAATLVATHRHPDWRDTIVVSVAFEGGTIGVLEASWRAVYGYDSRVEIHAPGGMLQAGGARGPSFHGLGGDARRYPTGFLDCFAEAYRREVASFVHAVRDGSAMQPGLDEALSSLRVAEAVRRSLETNRPVAIPARESAGKHGPR